jgi:outer membrane receptor for ferrienterochelin and colicin
VDGADAIDNSTNGVRSTVSQEAVQEFQIVSNSYAAEYGRASGGVVNIITRSGANDVRISAESKHPGGQSLQHGERSGIHTRPGGLGVWRSNQEG